MKNRKKEELAQLKEKIRSSAGFKIYYQRKAIEISYQIYERNYQDICNDLNFLEDFSVAARALANRDEKEQVELELQRKLFNCLAAAFALVDHTRKFIGEYSGNLSFKEEYNKRIDKEFTNSELHRFFQDYRNYMHHYRVPTISHRLQFGRDVENKYTCELKKEELLMWDGWKEKAKSWINKQPDNIPLKENLEEHHQKIIELYEWLLSRILQIHGQEIEETNKLIRQHNALLASPAIF